MEETQFYLRPLEQPESLGSPDSAAKYPRDWGVMFRVWDLAIVVPSREECLASWGPERACRVGPIACSGDPKAAGWTSMPIFCSSWLQGQGGRGGGSLSRSPWAAGFLFWTVVWDWGIFFRASLDHTGRLCLKIQNKSSNTKKNKFLPHTFSLGGSSWTGRGLQLSSLLSSPGSEPSLTGGTFV